MMEYFTSPRWLMYFMVVMVSVYVYTWYKQSYFRRMRIPSKNCPFFWGDLKQFSKKRWCYVDTDVVKKFGKVFGCYLGNAPFLVITDTDILQNINVNMFSKFADKSEVVKYSELWKNDITLADGNHWKLLRTTLQPAFSVQCIREVDQTFSVNGVAFPSLVDGIDTLIEGLQSACEIQRDGFDIFPYMHNSFVETLLFTIMPIIYAKGVRYIDGFSMDVIASMCFGMNTDAQSQPNNGYIKHAVEFIEYTGTRLLLIQILFPDVIKAFGRLMHSNINSTEEALKFYSDAVITAFQERQNSETRRADLLQILVDNFGSCDNERTIENDNKGKKKRGLTEDAVVINAIMILTGGYSIVQALLSWLIYDLATHSDVQDKLIDEIQTQIGNNVPEYGKVKDLQYLDMVVSETLRVHPPVTTLTRTPLEDVEINGIRLQKGLPLVVPITTLHLLPDYWTDPLTYVPERFSPENRCNINENAYLPFGRGPRSCISKHLALIVVKATIVRIMQRFCLRPTKKLKVPMPGHIGALQKPAATLYVKLLPR